MANCGCMLCVSIPRRVDKPILNRCRKCNNSPNYGHICLHKMCHKRSSCGCDLCLMVRNRDNRLPQYLVHLNWHHVKLLHMIEKRTEQFLWDVLLSRIHNNSLKILLITRLNEESSVEDKCECRKCVLHPRPYSFSYEYYCDDNICVGQWCIPGSCGKTRCKNLRLYGLQHCEFCWTYVRHLQTFMSEGYGNCLPLDLKKLIFNYIRG